MHMIVGADFDGDVDMTLAWVQHDLYFASAERPAVTIGGGSTLGWIWANVQHQAERRGQFIPWIDRNLERIQRIDGFNHKLLQVPHEHMAAYFRWTMPRISRGAAFDATDDTYPMDLLDSWRSFLKSDIPDLLSSDEALVALAKCIVYKSFDAGDDAYHDFQDVLMLRYGFACVEKTWWAAEVRDRVGAAADQAPKITNRRGAYA
jgi:hypothetical protein